MFKNKALLTVAAAAALLMANPVGNNAEASTITQGKVYVYQGTSFNMDEINRFLQNFYKQYQVQQPVQTQPSQTVELAPVPQQTTTPEQPTTTQPETTQSTTQPETTQSTTQPTATQPTATQPTATQPTATEPTTTQTTSTLSAYEQKVVDLTNQERAKNGAPALKVDETLSKMARDKSQDMATNQYFSHTSPTYGSPFDMMKKYGITYRYAGENIAMGQRTPEEVVQAWLNSEGHRKNILNPNFTHIGVGYIADGNYWTQEFIGK